MRTKNILRHLTWGVLGLVTEQVFSQATVSNNGGLAGAFLGWNAGANQTLQVRNDANQRIDWYTSAIQRMGLNHTMSYNIGPFGADPRNGFMGISGRPGLWTATKGPFTRLHLADDVGADDPAVFAQSYGYRPWMRNGITLTGNGDQGYMGQKFDGADRTDLIFQWSDNAGIGPEYSPDRLRFLFSSTYTGAASGSGSLSGLEAMRLFPKSQTEVNVGIGDFAPVAVGEPTERLDLLSGRLRIRQLPNDLPNFTSKRILVVDHADPTSPEYGVVKWRDINTLTTDCNWTLQGASGSNSHVATAYFGNTGCPQMDKGVGIGVFDPKAKLDVYHEDFSSLPRIGIQSRIIVNSQANTYGIRADVLPTTGSAQASISSAVYGTARNMRAARGVHGAARVDEISIGNGTNAYGLYGSAIVQNGDDTQAAIGVYGIANAINTPTPAGVMAVYGNLQAPLGTTNAWGGYFNGDVFTTGSYLPSDEHLKSNVEPVSGAMELIGSLVPRTYSFKTEEYPQMNLPQGERIGLLSQEVQEVLPALVKRAVLPAQLDSTGEQVYPAVEFLSLNYTELIPLLIAGFKEQSARIDEQNARLASLEEQLAACCSNPDGGTRSMPLGPAGTLEEGTGRHLLIQPNPFNEATTVSYTLERAGRMQLLVNSADGKQLNVLEEAQRSAGDYRYEWNTSALKAGMYYVTLLLDGQPVVKKAVKVAR